MAETKTKQIGAWWFSAGRILPHGDGRRIGLGTTHKVEPPILPCVRGLHGSKLILNALPFAPPVDPGRPLLLWRVTLSGVIVSHDGDKFAASERRYDAGGIDATDVLDRFARYEALDVAPLWNAPEIAVQFLRTGDEILRESATRAATAAATTGGIIGSAAWATMAATGSARLDQITSGAARAAIAATEAALAAANARGDTTWDATRAQQNRRLTRMVYKEIRKK